MFDSATIAQPSPVPERDTYWEAIATEPGNPIESYYLVRANVHLLLLATQTPISGDDVAAIQIVLLNTQDLLEGFEQRMIQELRRRGAFVEA